MDHFTRNGLTFDVTDSGPADGEVVVLLHGWPQDRHAYDRVIPLLTAAGYRALAFDQRGYSPGAQPKPVSAYAMADLVADVAGLLDAAGVDRAHLVGHDWGGAVAWATAERLPERLRSLTVLSTPHHRAMFEALRRPQQLGKSWYMLAFQVPVLPELVLKTTLEQVLRRSGLPAPEAHRYAARFRQGRTSSASLAWYRALGVAELAGATHRLRGILPRALGGADASSPPHGAASHGAAHRITVPTTYVWGNQDVALGRAAAVGTAAWVSADYRFVELDAGHWLPETRPHDVAAAILERAGS
ncbi:MAG: alpha/beta fold hydrolase [Nocardioidaceae bacterium]